MTSYELLTGHIHYGNYDHRLLGGPKLLPWQPCTSRLSALLELAHSDQLRLAMLLARRAGWLVLESDCGRHMD